MEQHVSSEGIKHRGILCNAAGYRAAEFLVSSELLLAAVYMVIGKTLGAPIPANATHEVA